MSQFGSFLQGGGGIYCGGDGRCNLVRMVGCDGEGGGGGFDRLQVYKWQGRCVLTCVDRLLFKTVLRVLG